jgi:hypothetical protein
MRRPFTEGFVARFIAMLQLSQGAWLSNERGIR